MVGREVEVLPGKDLLFTWKGKRKLFELVGARTETEFANKMAELAKTDGLDDELFADMYYIGLNWRKDGPVIPREEVADIIEEFCQVNGFGSNEVRDKLIDAFCESGIYDKNVIMASRKLQAQMAEDKLRELTKKKDSGKSDTGEAGQTSTLTN
jgi:hypothetical protein